MNSTSSLALITRRRFVVPVLACVLACLLLVAWIGTALVGAAGGDLDKPTADPGAPDLKTLAVDETCENCGGAMTVRRGKRGFFLGCSGYPKCKGTKEPSEATLEKITAFTGG